MSLLTSLHTRAGADSLERPRSFAHPQSFQDRLVLPDVIVTGRQIRPLICTRLQCLFRVLLVDGSNGPLDVHPRAEMCDHGVVVVNLGLRPVSDNLACSLKIGVDLVYVHEMSAILLSERQRPGPRDVWIATGARWPGSLQRPLRITIGIEPRTLIGLWVIFNLPIKEPAVVNHDPLFSPVLKLILTLARNRKKVAPNDLSAIANDSDKLNAIVPAVSEDLLYLAQLVFVGSCRFAEERLDRCERLLSLVCRRRPRLGLQNDSVCRSNVSFKSGQGAQMNGK